ncbi:hypothetical protein D3C83_247340 [compost metagenome]
MRYRPDDVLGPESGIAAEENAGIGRLQGLRIDPRHAPFVEFQADIALDPGECVFLAHRHQHVIALHHHIRFT